MRPNTLAGCTDYSAGRSRTRLLERGRRCRRSFLRSTPSLQKRLLRLHPLDPRAEGVEFLVDELVAAVDVIDAVDLGDAFGVQAGEDEGGGGAQVAGHDGRAAHALDAFDDGGAAVERDVGAHALELGDVHEALREDGVGDDADAAGLGEERAHLRLHVGREARIRLGGELEGGGLAVAGDGEGVAGRLDAVAGADEGVGDGGEVRGIDALEGDLLARDGGGDHEGAGLDAVGDDFVLGAVEFLHAFDDDAPGACALDLRAHLDQEIGEIDDLGLGGGAVDDGDAFGEDGGHHDVVGAEHGGAEFAAEVDGAAAQFAGEDFHIPRVDAVGSAEGLEAFEMQVDRAVADDAAAGQGDGGLFLATQQRADDADGRAHFPHNLVGSLGDDFLRLHGDGAARPLDLRAEVRQDLEHVMDVAQVRHMVDDARLSGEQRGGEDGERGVFRAADFDVAREGVSAVNEYFIHRLRRGIGGGLGSRSARGCLGNCAARAGRRGRRIGRGRSPVRAVRGDAAGLRR